MPNNKFQPPPRQEKRAAQFTIHMTDAMKEEIVGLCKKLDYETQNLFLLHLLEEGLIAARREAEKRGV